MGGCQVMHTKFSVRQKWRTRNLVFIIFYAHYVNLVCITWQPPRRAEIYKTWEATKWCTLDLVCIKSVAH